ncbi:DUF58 domain-containing protein [Janthinobacterium sp. RB2R34]|uniref:DUF58 domain-containing protein n=1 Tax=Janthinobacterium sp. RB2R34 TaxID=3424193 RepID=UPI003F2425D9
MRLASLLPTRPWLGAHRVHIRPSRAGLAFALLLLALWIAAVNYQLALGHALTWFAVACAITDMLFASRNLAGLALSATPGAMVAAGGNARFELRLVNRSARARHAIAVVAALPQAAPELVDVDAGGAASVSVLLPAGARGWLQAPTVRLSSNFPLGLFHAWCHWQPEARVLVYPRPEAAAPALPASLAAPHLQQAELTGVAAYRSGDPLRRLAWRHIARHDDEHLYSKQFQDLDGGQHHDDLLLDYATLPPQLDIEARLSRLCAWVLEADSLHLPYGLRLEQTLIAPGQGSFHLDACLRALALHGLSQPSLPQAS